jgi:hypothetical protein
MSEGRYFARAVPMSWKCQPFVLDRRRHYSPTGGLRRAEASNCPAVVAESERGLQFMLTALRRVD